MKKSNVYNSQNIFLLLGVFSIIFFLLYSLASFLHESRKINAEIEAIRQENNAKVADISEKKQYLEYLQTPERIEKEAKIQMGKKRPAEKVLVFVEDPTASAFLSSNSFDETNPDLSTFDTSPTPTVKKKYFEEWLQLFTGTGNQ